MTSNVFFFYTHLSPFPTSRVTPFWESSLVGSLIQVERMLSTCILLLRPNVIALFLTASKTDLLQDKEFANQGNWALAEGYKSPNFIEAWKKTADKRIAYCRSVDFEEYCHVCLYIIFPTLGHTLVRTCFILVFP